MSYLWLSNYLHKIIGGKYYETTFWTFYFSVDVFTGIISIKSRMNKNHQFVSFRYFAP